MLSVIVIIATVFTILLGVLFIESAYKSLVTGERNNNSRGVFSGMMSNLSKKEAHIDTNSKILSEVETRDFLAEEITTLVNSNLPEGSILKNIKINFIDNLINVSGKLTQPIAGDLYLEGELKQGSGKLVDIEITKISVNGLNIESFLSTFVENELERAIDERLSDLLDTNISSVEIVNGKLRVVY